MAIPELLIKPAIVGQYPDMRNEYNVTLPYPGAPVTWTYLDDMTLEEMEDYVTFHKGLFEANQLRTSDNPTQWIDVGYYLDLVDGLIYYSQYLFPDYTMPPSYVPEP